MSIGSSFSPSGAISLDLGNPSKNTLISRSRRCAKCGQGLAVGHDPASKLGGNAVELPCIDYSQQARIAKVAATDIENKICEGCELAIRQFYFDTSHHRVLRTRHVSNQ